MFSTLATLQWRAMLKYIASRMSVMVCFCYVFISTAQAQSPPADSTGKPAVDSVLQQEAEGSSKKAIKKNSRREKKEKLSPFEAAAAKAAANHAIDSTTSSVTDHETVAANKSDKKNSRRNKSETPAPPVLDSSGNASPKTEAAEEEPAEKKNSKKNSRKNKAEANSSWDKARQTAAPAVTDSSGALTDDTLSDAMASEGKSSKKSSRKSKKNAPVAFDSKGAPIGLSSKKANAAPKKMSKKAMRALKKRELADSILRVEERRDSLRLAHQQAIKDSGVITRLEDCEIPFEMAYNIKHMKLNEMDSMKIVYQKIILEEEEEKIVTIRMRFANDHIRGYMTKAPIHHSNRYVVVNMPIDVKVQWCCIPDSTHPKHCAASYAEIKHYDSTEHCTGWVQVDDGKEMVTEVTNARKGMDKKLKSKRPFIGRVVEFFQFKKKPKYILIPIDKTFQELLKPPAPKTDTESGSPPAPSNF